MFFLNHPLLCRHLSFLTIWIFWFNHQNRSCSSLFCLSVIYNTYIGLSEVCQLPFGVAVRMKCPLISVFYQLQPKLYVNLSLKAELSFISINPLPTLKHSPPPGKDYISAFLSNPIRCERKFLFYLLILWDNMNWQIWFKRFVL